MATVLQILGLILLVIVAALLLIVVLIWWKVRSVFRNLKGTLEGLQKSLAPTPSRLHLNRMAAPSWEDSDAIEEFTKPLPKLGFTEAGTYQTVEDEGLGLQAWVNPSKGVTAVVYEHPQAGVWIDLVTHYEDGTRCTYANTAQGGGVEHSPGHIVERFPNMSTEEMYQKLLAERPNKPLKPITADEFVAVFEKAYADEMDWRNSRGGPSEQEIRNGAALMGETYTDEQVSAVREQLERNALNDLGTALRERFLTESQMPAAAWERVRDRLVIIHDRLTPELLDSSLEDWLDEDAPPSEM